MKRRHIFDYYVVFKNGYRLGVAVKYFHKTALMEDILVRIVAAPSDVIDGVQLMTEVEASHEAYENARSILSARVLHDEDECERLLALVQTLHGRFRFGELLRGCIDRGKRRTAVWRLIDMGLLRSLSSGRISELSWLATVQ